MKRDPKKELRASMRRHVRAGVAIIILMMGGTALWASTTKITSAVIASGSIVVDSNAKKVQHPTGGIISELLVRDGDQVKAGDVLVRLDETVTRANLAIVTKALDELYARKARLMAERDGIDSVPLAPELADRKDDPQVARTVDGESKLFTMRRAARMGQKAQLAQRIDQLKKEIVGYEAQERGKAREIELINGELEGARKLWEQKLMPVTKYNELQRSGARLEGERGLLVATMAQLQGKISETELQIIQVDHDLNSEIGKELREDDTKIAELVERRVAAEDQLRRTAIKAPQSGTIYQSSVHTVGGVIGAGDTIMLVLPKEDSLKVEAKVAPQDIDQLRPGEHVRLRFSGLDRPTTPEIEGTVTIIAPDTSSDQRTGQTFYTIRIAIDPKEQARLGDIKLVPGMPVEVFIKTGERNVISYLLKPLQDQVNRAFREG
jgi:HlyD family secretion protein